MGVKSKGNIISIFLFVLLILLSVSFSYGALDGCDPDSSSCSDACDEVFTSSLGSFSSSSFGWCTWSYSGCYYDSYHRYVVNSDSSCDSIFGAGDGQCACGANNDYGGETCCPSYERNGNSEVTASDCIGGEYCGGWDTSIFDFDSEFFKGATGIVGGNGSTISDINPSLGIVYQGNTSIDMTQVNGSDVVSVFITNLSGAIIGGFDLNFSVETNISDIIADVDILSARSVLHIPSAYDSFISENKTLYIPVVDSSGLVIPFSRSKQKENLKA